MSDERAFVSDSLVYDSRSQTSSHIAFLFRDHSDRKVQTPTWVENMEKASAGMEGVEKASFESVS